MAILYRIDCGAHGRYFGKYADNDAHSFLVDEHLKFALPWSNHKRTESTKRWEYEWRESLLKTGFRQDIYFRDASYMSLESVVEELKKTMPTTVFRVAKDNRDHDCWEMLKRYWGKGDLEVAEALLILAGNADGQLMNRQIDFFSKKIDVSTADLENIVTEEELARRLGAVEKGLIDIPIIRTLESQDKIFDKMTDAVENLYGRYSGKTLINWSRPINAKARQQITKVVTDEVIKDMLNSLRTARNKLPSGLGRTAAYKGIRAIEEEVKTYLGRTEGELYQMVVSAIEKQHKQYLETIFKDKERAGNIKLLNECILSWVVNIHPDALFARCGRRYDEQWVENWYKREFVKFIKKTIFAKISYDFDYSESQHEIFETTPRGKAGFAWLPVTAEPFGTGVKGQASLMQATLKEIPPQFEFVRNNWLFGLNNKSIYGEQVSLWLRDQGDTFYAENVRGFAWQATLPEEIKNY